MMRKRTKTELLQYLKGIVIKLNLRINDYDNGEIDVYREIANQLRMLLCDTKDGKPNALLLKIYPEIKLSPLSFQPDPKDYYRNGGELGFFIHGPITTVNGIVRVPKLFDLNAKLIPINEWLEQCIISPKITLRDLIKSVVEKNGGTHVDEIINETLFKGEFLRLKNVQCKSVYIVEIARYVLAEINGLGGVSYEK